MMDSRLLREYLSYMISWAWHRYRCKHLNDSTNFIADRYILCHYKLLSLITSSTRGVEYNSYNTISWAMNALTRALCTLRSHTYISVIALLSVLQLVNILY